MKKQQLFPISMKDVSFKKNVRFIPDIKPTNWIKFSRIILLLQFKSVS